MAAKRRILLAEFAPRIPQPATYGTWNPADRNAAIVLSNGNLTATTSATSSNWSCVRGTVPMLAGQHYWETDFVYTGAADVAVGIASSTFSLALQPGQDAFLTYQSIAINKTGTVSVRGVVLAELGAIPSGTTVRHWLDVDARLYYIAIGAGSWTRITAPPEGDALAWSRIGNAGIYAVAGLTKPSGTCSIPARFGASAFLFPVPDSARPGVYSSPDPVPVSIYLASEAFNTGDGDTPKNTEYLARIEAEPDVIIERGITCWPWGGTVSSRRGQLSVVNADGRLNDWMTWIWRDAAYTLYSGYEGDPRSAFTVWSRGVVDSLDVSDQRRYVILFADPLARLERSALPQSYPADAANVAIAGKSVPMVLGRPLYCEPVLVSTAESGSDAFRYELDYVGLDGIDAVFDRGDRDSGPNDPYTATSPITLANGGNFNSWANDSGGVPMPANWKRVTAFTAADRFQQGVVAGTLRCISSGQAWAAIYHLLGVFTAGVRYRIQFTVTRVDVPGNIILRLDGNRPGFDEIVVPITATGVIAVDLDCTDSNYGLQIVLGRTLLDVTIDDLTAGSVQVIDWTQPDNKGFKRANKADGKITANPRGAREAFDWIPLDNFDTWLTTTRPANWVVVGGPESATLRVVQNGSSARFQSPGGGTNSIGLQRMSAVGNLGRSQNLRAGHTYFVSIACSARVSGSVQVLVAGSATVHGTISAVGSQVITITPAAAGALVLRTPPGTAADISIDYVQVSDVRVAEGLPDFMRQLLVNRAGLAPSDVDWASLIAVDDGWPDDTDFIVHRLAYYSGQQPQTYAQIVQQVMDSFCGWCVPNRLGQLTFGALRKPSGTPVLTLDPTNIAGDIRVRPALSPNLSTKLSGRRTHSPTSGGEIATSVPSALRAEMQAEYTRTVSAAPGLLSAGQKPISDALIAAIDAPPRPTLLQETAGLQIQANRVATLHRDPAWFADVDALLPATQADALEPGQVVRLIWPGYGLDAGQLALVARMPSAFFGAKTSLTLWLSLLT